MATAPIGLDPSLSDLAVAFEGYLSGRAPEHERYKLSPPSLDERIPIVCDLQRDLFDAGWARYGWPAALGGFDGSVLHRAVVTDLLGRNGYPPRQGFEHLDILLPALTRFATTSVLEELFLPSLRGDVIWCQGFSEPTAGSDLAALRTRAVREHDVYRIEGHKVWTSWAKWASHCLFLARTGSTEDRHRGLSAFVIDMSSSGLDVGVIRQANGTDELAEVFFDGAVVPVAQRLGEEGEGWAVAMHILAGERGSYAWLRQAETLPKLERLARDPRAPRHAGLLGESLTRMIALRCSSRAVMEILARGDEPGPGSSMSKVMVIDAEQRFYEDARRILSPDLDLGCCDDVEAWQESYLYSRAAGIYGGSRQIQLNVIARQMIERGESPRETKADEESAEIRRGVLEAIGKSASGRQALAGLDWWSQGAEPRDAFGRAAFAAFFEGQGRVPMVSPALSGVRGSSAAAALGAEPASIAMAVGTSAGAAGDVLVYGYDGDTSWIVAEVDGGGLRVLSAEGARVVESNAIDPDLLCRLSLRDEGRVLTVDPLLEARARALARVAAAYEILGASLALLDRAIVHAKEREQFGRPIARFQAVAHLLAEAQVEVVALADLCDSALEECSAGGSLETAVVAKAFAGRASRTVAQHALQCFGAIGFTEEHPHHRYSRRIHALDAILGSGCELEEELGAALARTGAAPRCIEAWHRLN